MPTNGTFRVSGVRGIVSGETNTACLYLSTSAVGTDVLGLTESASLQSYSGSKTVSLTDPSGPYEYEVRSCTAATQVAFDAATGATSLRRTRGPYTELGGPYFSSGLWYPYPSAATPALTGSGNVAVNHNTTGTDAFRVVDTNAQPVSGATINCYLTSVYTAGNAGPSTDLGQTTTAADGRWADPIMLTAPNSGTLNFTLVTSLPGSKIPTTTTLTVDSTGAVTTP